MNEKIVKFNLSQRDNKDIPDLQAGDIVKVHRKIVEGKKERVQIFEGIVIAINGKQSSSPTVTVRKVSNGVGVELVLPIFSPNIEKIEIVKRAKVRRSKLYYIRDKSAKSLRLKYKDMAEFVAVEEPSEDESGEKEEEASSEEVSEDAAEGEEKKESKKEKSKEGKGDDASSDETKKEDKKDEEKEIEEKDSKEEKKSE